MTTFNVTVKKMARPAKPLISESRPKTNLTVEDRMEQIVRNTQDEKELTPKDFDFILDNIDRIGDGLERPFTQALRTRGLPFDKQVPLLQVDSSYVEHLPDVGPQAQRWLLNQGRNLDALVEKIPDISKMTTALLKHAVNSSHATPEIIKYLLVEYGKELSGMGLRLPALLHSPEVLADLPAMDLTADEQRALVKADIENYKYIRKPEPSVRQAYRDFMVGERESPEDSAIQELGSKSVADLVDELREAEVRGNTVHAEKLRAMLKKLRDEIDAKAKIELNPEAEEEATEFGEEVSESDGDPDTPKPDGSPEWGQGAQAVAHGKTLVDRTDLTGYVVQGPDRRYLVLQDVPTLGGALPNWLRNTLPQGVDPQVDRCYRLADLSSKTTVALLPDRNWSRVVKVLRKYSPKLFSEVVEEIKDNDNWNIQAVLGPNFQAFTEIEVPETPEDELGDAAEFESESDGTEVPEEEEDGYAIEGEEEEGEDGDQDQEVEEAETEEGAAGDDIKALTKAAGQRLKHLDRYVTRLTDMAARHAGTAKPEEEGENLG